MEEGEPKFAISYGNWERGLLPVKVNGDFAGYLSDDDDGWAFWSPVKGKPKRFELHAIAPTRKQAVTESLKRSEGVEE